jgi:hypothetical protein
MSWISLLDGSHFLSLLFPGEPPSLESVELHEIKLESDGPVVRLRFDLPDFPASPPRKWVDQKFNVVQVEIMGIGVRSISLNGWSHNNIASIRLTKEGSEIQLRVRGDTVVVDATFGHIRVAKVSAYSLPESADRVL